jgi:hypothetical protein
MPRRRIAAVGLFGRPSFLRERLIDAVLGACGPATLPAVGGRHACSAEVYGAVAVLLAHLENPAWGFDGQLAGLLLSAGPEGLKLRLLYSGQRPPITLNLGWRAGQAIPCVARASADG